MLGFSCGGQYGAAATYLSEIAQPGRRGLFGSLQFVTLIGGQLSALLVLWLLQASLGEAAIRAWAWRIPFVIGAALAFSLLLFRGMMHETLEGEKGDASTLKRLFEQPRALFTVMSLSAGGGLCLYTFTTYLQKYLVNTAGLSVPEASRAVIGATVGFLLLQPIIGPLSDRIGRRTCLLIFSGGMTIGAVPLLDALGHAGSVTSALALAFAALGIL